MTAYSVIEHISALSYNAVTANLSNLSSSIFWTDLDGNYFIPMQDLGFLVYLVCPKPSVLQK